MTGAYPNVPGVTFKDVVGFHGYCVGDDGSVWSRRKKGKYNTDRLVSTWHRLKPTKNHHGGHLFVSLRAGGRDFSKFVHRLVLEAFVGPQPDGKECCHGNGVPSDNRLSNLRWDTHRANVLDSVKHGRNFFNKGELHPNIKINNTLAAELAERYRAGESFHSIAKQFGLSEYGVKTAALTRGGLSADDVRSVRKGENHWRFKVTDADSVGIAARYLAGESTRELGARFGVSRVVILSAIRRAGISDAEIKQRGHEDMWKSRRSKLKATRSQDG